MWLSRILRKPSTHRSAINEERQENDKHKLDMDPEAKVDGPKSKEMEKVAVDKIEDILADKSEAPFDKMIINEQLGEERKEEKGFKSEIVKEIALPHEVCMATRKLSYESDDTSRINANDKFVEEGHDESEHTDFDDFSNYSSDGCWLDFQTKSMNSLSLFFLE